MACPLSYSVEQEKYRKFHIQYEVSSRDVLYGVRQFDCFILSSTKSIRSANDCQAVRLIIARTQMIQYSSSSMVQSYLNSVACISLFKRRKADLREDVLLTCRISSIHRYTSSYVVTRVISIRMNKPEIFAHEDLVETVKTDCFVTDGIIRRMLESLQNLGIQIAFGKKLVDLEYADDIVLVFEEKARVFPDELTKVILHLACVLYRKV
ncbi:hypothetical protein CLF_101441 [Clonorchis sinensis]|uniref:Uncharacterized protein n=1 Tax=Clonorchis sinensis TaxID=79923 RepID=G7Y5R9_CLOSI|nr:hypothetical protein CLF_101441 [Clonorchis sinensis]